MLEWVPGQRTETGPGKAASVHRQPFLGRLTMAHVAFMKSKKAPALKNHTFYLFFE